MTQAEKNAAYLIALHGGEAAQEERMQMRHKLRCICRDMGYDADHIWQFDPYRQTFCILCDDSRGQATFIYMKYSEDSEGQISVWAM